jgi:hypothetical protein
MNLFRSEEHPRAWVSFNPDVAHNLQPLSYWLERFSAERFRSRIRADYISWLRAQP